MLGVTNSSRLQQDIQEESQHHRDIIQLDIIDSYLNLTLKVLSMFHWTTTYCPGAKWIVKSDDDVFVNPFALRTYLQWYPNASFLCRMNKNLKVCRLGGDCPEKWAVSVSEYPKEYYPRYCDGPAYVVANSMARLVYLAANKTHPHLMEDAYFTGIVARPFNPKYKNLSLQRFPKKCYFLRDKFWNGISLFMLNLEVKAGSSYQVWNKILNYNNITLVK